MKTSMIPMTALLVAVVGCEPLSKRVDALDSSLWAQSEWISVADAPVFTGQSKDGARAADGTSWFVREIENEGEVKSAVWMTTGLGVYEVYVNGRPVGSDEALKPGFTHTGKTRRSFTYDVIGCLKKGKGEKNFFAAEVSAGWWRDKIVNFAGKKSAFRAVLQVTYADGSVKVYGTKADEWKAAIGGPVKHAAIFDGEEYDARVVPPYFGGEAFRKAERNDEFKGEILPSEGGEICRRKDKALKPVEAYIWKGVDGANEANKIFGRVHKLRNVSFDGKTPVSLAKGETLVVDFGQNCAAVPAFVFKAVEGPVLTCLPAEMLNDANGERSRGNDGPGGSVYRENLRIPNLGMRAVYTFGNGKDGPYTIENGFSVYVPVFTFFGYRYVSITATDDVEFLVVGSIPVTSIKQEMEIGKIETGVADVNKLISNVYWGQLSNYLSVPTDCPQRNERLGWTADTQVFAHAGSFNADTYGFFIKWMRDMRDTQHEDGSYTGVAPLAQYGGNGHQLGWADAGIIVPYVMWRQFGDTRIIDENWDSMKRYVALVESMRYESQEATTHQWADWLSYEKLESCGGNAYIKDANGNRIVNPDALTYWKFLGFSYWLWDARMMADMAKATGRTAEAKKYLAMADGVLKELREKYVAKDGLLIPLFRDMQTPALFALKFGILEKPAAIAATKAALLKNIKDHGDCLQTGFLGTSILMDTMTYDVGAPSVAYTLLLQHKNPSWLYSVDQGATTIWERWNSYTKASGFGPSGMNSFNHYAYGAVLSWMYGTMAGIRAGEDGGFKSFTLAPIPDARMGKVDASFDSPYGTIRSAWSYDKDGKWTWTFTIPANTIATVRLPWGAVETLSAGTYTRSGR